MRSGKLKNQITIQEMREVQNVYGEPETTWAVFAEPWAAVEPLRGREFWAAQELQSRVTTRIRIRYVEGITPKMRVLFGTRIYLINTVIDQEEGHRETQLMCEELVET
jgi:SPP1 family predicted phage head-tail adaptor